MFRNFSAILVQDILTVAHDLPAFLDQPCLGFVNYDWQQLYLQNWRTNMQLVSSPPEYAKSTFFSCPIIDLVFVELYFALLVYDYTASNTRLSTIELQERATEKKTLIPSKYIDSKCALIWFVYTLFIFWTNKKPREGRINWASLSTSMNNHIGLIGGYYGSYRLIGGSHF